MRDARAHNGLWVKDAQVLVKADSSVHSDLRTWRTMAVLEVHPRNVPFQIGWRTEQFAPAEFYSESAETDDAKLSMEVGDQSVWFVVRPLDRRTQLIIELVVLTTKDDPKYHDTPRY